MHRLLNITCLITTAGLEISHILSSKKILSFLVICSLFFSSTSFAVYDQAQTQEQYQDQGSIMQHLVDGKPSCRLSKVDLEEFKKSKGHCFGFSAVWLYSKWLQLADSGKISATYSYDWYKNTVTDILGTWSNCANITNFASVVKKLHNSQYLRTFEKEMSQLGGENRKKLQKEYSIASLLTLEQLKQLLKENIIHDHKLIFIHSHNHVTALFKDRDKYYYFDPSCGEITLSSIDDVAEVIFYSNRFENTKSSPLALEIFSFDEKTTNYLNQQEILERLNPSLVAERNYAGEYTGLHRAAYIGCLESVRYFLNKGVVIDQIDINGRTALMVAAQNGHLEVVQLLLKKGAEINKADKIQGGTALILSAESGHLEIIQLLLEKGAVIDQPDMNGRTALMTAAQNNHLEVVRLLLKKGAEIDKTENHGWTTLMLAAYYNYTEVVQLLVDKGADINKKNNDKYRAIDIAKKKSNKNTVKILKIKKTS